MVAVLVFLLPWTSTSPDNLIGTATYYSPGRMEQVAKYRGMDLAGYAGGVAMNRKGDLGRSVWLEFDRAIEGPFLVVDCAKRTDYENRLKAGHVIEVDAETAMRHGFYGVGPVPIHVYFDDVVTCTIAGCPF